MELLGKWQQTRRLAVACLAFFLLVALYLGYKQSLALPHAWAAWVPQQQRPRPPPLADQNANTTVKDLTRLLPLLGTLPSNTSSPTTLDCNDRGWRQYLRAVPEGAPWNGWQHDWQPAVGAGARLHQCTVGVQEERKHVARDRFQGV